VASLLVTDPVIVRHKVLKQSPVWSLVIMLRLHEAQYFGLPQRLGRLWAKKEASTDT